MQAMCCRGCEAPQGQQRSLSLLYSICGIIPVLQAFSDSLGTYLTTHVLSRDYMDATSRVGRQLLPLQQARM